jgi:hypothetical protein
MAKQPFTIFTESFNTIPSDRFDSRSAPTHR